MDSDNNKVNKHITISRRIYEDVVEFCPNLMIYLGTHSHISVYNKAEQKSGLEFWGIRLHSSEKPTRKTDIKHPDGVITGKEIARYILEIKWGYTPGIRQESDLSKMVKSGELNEIRDAISKGRICRVGKHKFPTEYAHREDFIVTETTKFLLVSDFQETMRHEPGIYNMVMRSLNELEPQPILLDYKQTHESDSGYGTIQSFHDYISSDIEQATNSTI